MEIAQGVVGVRCQSYLSYSQMTPQKTCSNIKQWPERELWQWIWVFYFKAISSTMEWKYLWRRIIVFIILSFSRDLDSHHGGKAKLFQVGSNFLRPWLSSLLTGSKKRELFWPWSIEQASPTSYKKYCVFKVCS